MGKAEWPLGRNAMTEVDPHKAILLGHRKRWHPDARKLFGGPKGGDRDADTLGIVAPAMVATFDGVTDHATLGEGHIPVGATIYESSGASVCLSKQHEVATQHRPPEGL